MGGPFDESGRGVGAWKIFGWADFFYSVSACIDFFYPWKVGRLFSSVLFVGEDFFFQVKTLKF